MDKSLSQWTARLIAWKNVDTIVKELGLPQHAAGADPCADAEKIPDRVRLLEAFRVCKEEFAKAITPLRWQVNILNWILMPASAIAIIVGLGILLADTSKIAGGVTGGSGLAVMTGVAVFSWRLGRDQVLLELIPTTYQTLFDLAVDPKQYCRLFNSFRAEMHQMRRRLGH